MSRIIEAMDTLERAGFYTGNLWTIHDVKHKFKCTDKEAMEVLDTVFSNDWVIEQIQLAIYEAGDTMQLTKTEEAL